MLRFHPPNRDTMQGRADRGGFSAVLPTDAPRLVRLAASRSSLRRTSLRGRIPGEAYKQKGADVYYMYLPDEDAARIFAPRVFTFYYISGSDGQRDGARIRPQKRRRTRDQVPRVPSAVRRNGNALMPRRLSAPFPQP